MRWVILFILLNVFSSTFSQKITAEYRISDLNKISRPVKNKFKDSTELASYLEELQHAAWTKNYIEFSIDSIDFSASKYLIFGQTGEHFDHIELRVDHGEFNYIKRQLTRKNGSITINKLSPENIHEKIDEILNLYTENGYPFVEINLEKISVDKSVFKGELIIDRGPLVKWSKIHIRGDSSLNERFITNLVNIKEDDLYDERIFKNISETVNNTPYLSERSAPEILFTKDGAELFLYLDNVPRSSVNGIVGFQPDPVSNRLNFTGDVRLKLLNVLKHGEKLNLSWQSVAKQTQSLRSSVSYPYLFNTPFGISAEFNLYKRDSSFLETDASFGVGYNLTPSWNLQVLYSRNSSNLLSGTFTNNDQRGTVKTNLYGIASENSHVDYLPNPTKGYYFNVRLQGGIRSFQRNDSAFVEKDQTIRSEINFGVFLPLKPRHIIHLENQTAYYYAEEIFSNELYRFGGLLEQRGFNEDELLASTRSTLSLEYRFLLDKNSNVFAFFDVSWYEQKIVDYLRDIPYGTGLGLSFSTGIGVFNLVYAIGQQMNNGFQLSNSKVHFGYSAIF